MTRAATFLQRQSLEDARRLLVAGVEPLDAEDIAVDDAAGRIAAERVVALHPSPHYRASAMDGIAVRAADTAAAPLVLAARNATGAPLAGAVDEEAPPAGTAAAVPVDTGSPLPSWCDAVVRSEDTTPEGGGTSEEQVGWKIHAAVAAGRDVRQAGEDIEAGSVLVADGAKLRPWDLGALLATGTLRIRVRRRPRIAILATGSEVVEPVAEPGAGHVVESSSRVISAYVAEWGGSAHRLGIVTDDEARLAEALSDAARRYDAVCVIAGSAAGRKDFTIATLASLGDVFVHGVDIAPGRPVALARVHSRDGRTTPVVAMPGYPVATVVACETLLRPLIAALLGSAEPLREAVRARVSRKIASRLGVEEFRRVCLVRQADDSLVIAPLPAGAGSISSVSGAHAWLRIDATVEGLDAGSDVDVELLVPRSEVDAAFVVAGSPSPASAKLELELRRTDLSARVVHLRLAGEDAVDAVARGEAHGTFVDEAAPLPAGCRRIGRGASLVVAAGSHVERRLAARRA